MQKTLKITLILLALFVGQTAGATVALMASEAMPVSVTTLKKGARGAEVSALQSQLAGMPGVYPEGLITGYFGTLTERAVKVLQAQNGLEQVGFVGPKTRELLLKLSKKGIYLLDTTLKNTIDEMNNPKAAPQIIDVIHNVNSTSTAYVFWTTNKYTTSDFYYATTTPLASTTPMTVTDSNASFTHSVNLTGLNPNTTYYYMVKINDNRGNPATTTERFFTTKAN